MKVRLNRTEIWKSPFKEFCFIWCGLHNRVIYHVHVLCYFFVKRFSDAYGKADTCYKTLSWPLYLCPILYIPIFRSQRICWFSLKSSCLLCGQRVGSGRTWFTGRYLDCYAHRFCDCVLLFSDAKCFKEYKPWTKCYDEKFKLLCFFLTIYQMVRFFRYIHLISFFWFSNCISVVYLRAIMAA